jgi:hypothetical protein
MFEKNQTKLRFVMLKVGTAFNKHF